MAVLALSPTSEIRNFLRERGKLNAPFRSVLVYEMYVKEGGEACRSTFDGVLVSGIKEGWCERVMNGTYSLIAEVNEFDPSENPFYTPVTQPKHLEEIPKDIQPFQKATPVPLPLPEPERRPMKEIFDISGQQDYYPANQYFRWNSTTSTQLPLFNRIQFGRAKNLIKDTVVNREALVACYLPDLIVVAQEYKYPILDLYDYLLGLKW